MNKMTKFKLMFADNKPASYYIKFIETVVGPDTEVEVMYSTNRKDKPDLLLFTGGEDVNPILYNEPKGSRTYINAERDEVETNSFYNHLGVPKLGICKGAQFLTVMSGGKLIQHVTGHNTTHNIEFVSHFRNLELPITSSHHQMMFPYNMNSENYKIIAQSSYFKSNTYLDGNDREIELPKEFVEPEIIHYPGTKSLCIQGHPEWMDQQSDTVQYLKQLINEILL